jgi:NadR type nicotinamide-nucleotide adenylyltransferase
MIEPVIKKIVVIGPESTGKSTLCEQLAQHYNTSWCPEYAREYLLKHGMNYTYDNLLVIAKGQIALEERFELGVRSQGSLTSSRLTTHDSRLLFIDTDLYVMKVWSEFVFGKCHPWILEQIAQRKYDLYLLCKTDLPWVKDELREYPDLAVREKLFLIYKDMMINQSTPWVEVSGDYKERLRKSIYSIDQLL